MTFFSSLLEGLGKELNTKLAPDARGNCVINFLDKFDVYIQPARNEQILVCCSIGVVPPGAFREKLLKSALIANGFPPPHKGVLAYSEDADSLVLFEHLHTEGLNAKKLYDYIQDFNGKITIWRDAIESGEIPSAFRENSFKGTGPFGM